LQIGRFAQAVLPLNAVDLSRRDNRYLTKHAEARQRLQSFSPRYA
jgi:hypothetical protein